MRWRRRPSTGGTLVFAVSAEPPNYDCHAQTSFAFLHPVRPHYSTLLKFDTANYPKVMGDLAESWTVAPGRPHLHVQAPAQRQVSRRHADDLGGRQGDLRAAAQAAAGRAVDTRGNVQGHHRDRNARSVHGRVQAFAHECVDAVELRVAVGLRLQRGQAQGRSQVSRAQHPRDGPVHVRRAPGRLALDRQEVRRLLRAGQALPRRLSGGLHQRRADGQRLRRRPGAGRVPRPVAGRPRPPRAGAGRQGGRGRVAVGLQPGRELQHQEEALRRSARAQGALARHRSVGGRAGAAEDRAGAPRRRPACVRATTSRSASRTS